MPLRPPSVEECAESGTALHQYGSISDGNSVGAGQFGSVFRTTTGDGRPVAVKINRRPLVPGTSADEEEEQAAAIQHEHDLMCFTSEVGVMRDAAVSHPNIVEFVNHGVCQHRGVGSIGFIVLELLEGKDLRKMLFRERNITLPQARKWAEQLASALAHLHDLRVIHRDVKPSNCMICDAEHETHSRLKLVDFGLSLRFPPKVGVSGAAAATVQELCITSFQVEQRVGVPAYMAPEVYRRVPYGTPVDVYAFGAVLQRMLANAVPPNAFEKLRASLMQRPATASRWPPDLLELTRDCCAAEALHRPRARQLVELLASHAVSIDGAEG